LKITSIIIESPLLHLKITITYFEFH